MFDGGLFDVYQKLILGDIHAQFVDNGRCVYGGLFSCTFYCILYKLMESKIASPIQIFEFVLSMLFLRVRTSLKCTVHEGLS